MRDIQTEREIYETELQTDIQKGKKREIGNENKSFSLFWQK